MEILEKEINELLSQDFFSSDFDPEGESYERAQLLLDKYSWDTIYNFCYKYFTEKCLTAKALYSALNLYHVYDYINAPVPNPYELVGYILYRIDLDKYWDEYGDFIDTFTISIIDKALNTNHMSDGYYRSWEDPLIIASIENWKKKNES